MQSRTPKPTKAIPRPSPTLARPKSLSRQSGLNRKQHEPAKMLKRVGILGTGTGLPDRVLTNRDLEGMVQTSDDWIIARTGIRERRLVAPGQAASDLAYEAAQRALETSRLAVRDLELIIIATVTPDHICPPTACILQDKLGATKAAGFDISAACSGFVNGLMVGHNMLATGAYKNALVVGVDILSSITDYQDRGSCILFGDGAGAVVLTQDPQEHELLDHMVGLDGSGAKLIQVRAGGSRRPASQEKVANREHFLELEGPKVFRFAVNKVRELVGEITERNGLSVSDIDLFIPHQANLRIIEAAVDKLGLSMDRVVINVERYGNTSSASVPLALDEAVRAGRLNSGDLVCMAAFGGGLSWGANLMRW